MEASIFKSYTPEQLTEWYKNFLINNWSYSRVTQFARNQKAFEMIHIYGYNAKMSATTIAGQAYHCALEFYFKSKKEGNEIDLPMLEATAYDFIDNVGANKWKLQKNTPSVEECKLNANKTVTDLLRNFYGERSVYEAEIEEIIDVEIYCEEFLTINGVDVPLPCRFKTDLIVKLKTGKIAIIDHKSKKTFSNEEELRLSIGVQAITYVKGYEAKTSLAVDEVWFVENKYSHNRDKSPQLNCFRLELTDDTRKLYEALLYEPLRKMLEAVNDPDYVYVINESDNLVDRAEIYDFWCTTQIGEIGDFNVPEDKQEIISKRLKKIKDSNLKIISPKVLKHFKENAAEFIQYDLSNKNMSEEQKIEHILRSFGCVVKVAHKFDGYQSNTYLLEINPGVKISSIHSHKLDLANALNVSTVRISKDLVVHEDKSYLAIEFSKKREKDLIFDPKALVAQKIPLGKDNLGNVIVWDFDNHSTPHALVCGATGSGKSVEIKTIIEYARLAKITKIVIMDPKFEFVEYASVRNITVCNEIEDIENEMQKLVDDMNYLVKNGEKRKTLLIIDEYADALSSSRKGADLKIFEKVETISKAGVKKVKKEWTGEYMKSMDENLKILLQKGRSSGFRILAATQRASVKVITGDAKVNFPVQICFRVPKEADSRVVIDEAGAESLAGMGDGLIKSPQYQETVRFQAYYKP